MNGSNILTVRPELVEGNERKMILGIGVDTIEINRFALWHTYSRKKIA